LDWSEWKIVFRSLFSIVLEAAEQNPHKYSSKGFKLLNNGVWNCPKQQMDDL